MISQLKIICFLALIFPLNSYMKSSNMNTNLELLGLKSIIYGQFSLVFALAFIYSIFVQYFKSFSSPYPTGLPPPTATCPNFLTLLLCLLQQKCLNIYKEYACRNGALKQLTDQCCRNFTLLSLPMYLLVLASSLLELARVFHRPPSYSAPPL